MKRTGKRAVCKATPLVFSLLRPLFPLFSSNNLPFSFEPIRLDQNVTEIQKGPEEDMEEGRQRQRRKKCTLIARKDEEEVFYFFNRN